MFQMITCEGKPFWSLIKSRSHQYFIRKTIMFEKGHSGKMKKRAKQLYKISQSRGKQRK